MAKPADSSAPGSNRPRWAVLVFLVGFMIGVVLLAFYYVYPALIAMREAHRMGYKTGARAISATSALLLAVLLLILVSGILVTFRFGRFFFPRRSSPPVKTEYVDAWAESARRMKMPDDQGQSDEL